MALARRIIGISALSLIGIGILGTLAAYLVGRGPFHPIYSDPTVVKIIKTHSSRHFTRHRSQDMTPVTHTMAMRRQFGIVFEKRPWW
ncbi:MAG: hypothetical protein AAGE61_21360, partial [Pseudomonadota bacterium]